MALKLQLYPPGYPMILTEDTVLIAQWEALGTAHYTITFDANGGSGEMPNHEFSIAPDEGTYSYKLPYCLYNPPRDMAFEAWRVNGTEYRPRDIVELNDDTVVTAIWYSTIIA